MVSSGNLYRFDDSYRKKGLTPLAGIDEAGRGPIAGPVVAATVILSPDIRFEGLKDSKKLSTRQREKLFEEICCNAEDIGIGIVDSPEIDRMNIYQATKKGMMLAVNNLKISPRLLIIDAMELPVDIKQVSRTKAEDLSASVAAASIIAKVTRDRMMADFHNLYPLYGFNAHKGYATKYHIRTLEIYGPCPIHRKSFLPVNSLKLPF